MDLGCETYDILRTYLEHALGFLVSTLHCSVYRLVSSHDFADRMTLRLILFHCFLFYHSRREWLLRQLEPLRTQFVVLDVRAKDMTALLGFGVIQRDRRRW
jgi:hypothetical protein